MALLHGCHPAALILSPSLSVFVFVFLHRLSLHNVLLFTIIHSPLTIRNCNNHGDMFLLRVVCWSWQTWSQFLWQPSWNNNRRHRYNLRPPASWNGFWKRSKRTERCKKSSEERSLFTGVLRQQRVVYRGGWHSAVSPWSSLVLLHYY